MCVFKNKKMASKVFLFVESDCMKYFKINNIGTLGLGLDLIILTFTASIYKEFKFLLDYFIEIDILIIQSL